MDEIVFEVGSTHKNEKGIYEVLSMEEGKDSMVIRWESGEEAATTISFQKRIIERVQAEREAAKNGNGAKRGARAVTGGATFDGFKETDFSGRIAGTTWRTQKGLGGVVTNLLNLEDPQIKSWAVPRMPEAHWMDASRQDNKAVQAKFFVRLDKDNLRYGFYVERSKEQSESQSDWKGFVEWLRDGENESRLKEIVDEFDLRIYDTKGKARPFDGQIRVGDGNWHLQNGEDVRGVESLADFLGQLPETASIDLQIAKTTRKEDAIGRGEEMAGDITGLFDTLMPLYKAAMA